MDAILRLVSGSLILATDLILNLDQAWKDAR